MRTRDIRTRVLRIVRRASTSLAADPQTGGGLRTCAECSLARLSRIRIEEDPVRLGCYYYLCPVDGRRLTSVQPYAHVVEAELKRYRLSCTIAVQPGAIDNYRRELLSSRERLEREARQAKEAAWRAGREIRALDDTLHELKALRAELELAEHTDIKRPETGTMDKIVKEVMASGS